jgi:hypothetical protein
MDYIKLTKIHVLYEKVVTLLEIIQILQANFYRNEQTE